MMSPSAHGRPYAHGPGRRLLVWVVIAATGYSFLPSTAWYVVRWPLVTLLVIEVSYLVFRKYNRPA